MLLNNQGQQINLNARINSVEHPRILANFCELLEPASKSCGNMFHLETRARIIDKR